MNALLISVHLGFEIAPSFCVNHASRLVSQVGLSGRPSPIFCASVLYRLKSVPDFRLIALLIGFHVHPLSLCVSM
jgi:hypothetical protein